MSSWTAALRTARRDARRARGRSALVVAMIALPVLGVTAIDVVARTDQLSPQQAAERQIGQADGTLGETPYASFDQYGDNAEPAPRPEGAVVDLSAGLPPGSRTLPDRTRYEVPVVAGERSARTQVRELAYDEPLARGIYEQDSGRAPAGPREAALTTALADRLGVGVGDELAVAEQRLDVVGLVRSTSSRSDRKVLVDPGGVLAATGPPGPYELLFDVPGALDLDVIAAANALGVQVTPALPVPGAPTFAGGPAREEVAVLGLVVTMALLEVVLLAGPAFAVGARRQARQLALLAATGGERRDVRRTVLAGGLVLGVVAGAVGGAAGLGAGSLAVALANRYGDTVQPPLDVRPLELLAIAVVGVLTAVLAALLPARTAARQDVVGALTGRRGAVRTSWRLTGLGVAGAVAGAAIAFTGALQRDTVVLVAGSVLAELGLVATTPALVGLAGRLGPRLPVGPRLALRDASRQRARTAPAVAAILAAVAGSVAVGTYVTSLDAHDEARYRPAALPGSVVIGLGGGDVARLPQALDALRASLPVEDVVAPASLIGAGSDRSGTSTYAALTAPPSRRCPLDDALADAPLTEGQQQRYAEDPRCDGSFFTEVYGELARTSSLGSSLVGDAGVLAAVTGARGTALEDALDAGGAVVPAPYLEDGRAWVSVETYDDLGTSVSSRVVSVPAVALPADALPIEVFSPGAAETIGVTPTLVGVVATTTRAPTDADEDRLGAALRRADLTDAAPYLESGYQSRYALGLVALVAGSALLVLGASGIATGLAAADGRADLSTLAAVGATPGLRRRLAALQSAVTAGLGTALGVVAGLVPAYGLLVALNRGSDQDDRYPLLVPWELLLVTALVVPLLAALAAGLLTRSRLPLVRRPA